MADAGYAYGIGAGSVVTITGGPTGTVIESFKPHAKANQKLIVYNNDAGQTVAQSTMTQISGDFTAEMEFKGWSDPLALINKTGTIIAKSANSTQVSTGTYSITIEDAAPDINRGIWLYTVSGSIDSVVA